MTLPFPLKKVNLEIIQIKRVSLTLATCMCQLQGQTPLEFAWSNRIVYENHISYIHIYIDPIAGGHEPDCTNPALT